MKEFLLVLVFFLQIISQSTLITGDYSALFNLATIFLIGICVFRDIPPKNVLSYLLLIAPILISFSFNVHEQHIGGGNTTVILLFSTLFLFTHRVGLDLYLFYRFFKYLCFSFLSLVFMYYFFINESLILRGPFSNQNTTAMVAYSLLAIICVISYQVRNKRFSGIDLIICLLFLVILLTQSRSGLIASLIFLPFYCWYRFRYFALIICGVIISSVVIILSTNEALLQRVIIRLTDTSGSGRIQIWYEACQIIMFNVSNFLFGVGVNKLSFSYGAADALSVHNSYINFVLNYGVLAFFVYIFFVFVKARQALSKSLLFFLVALSTLVYGLFETNLFVGFTPIWLSFLYLNFMATSVEVNYPYTNYSIRASYN